MGLFIYFVILGILMYFLYLEFLYFLNLVNFRIQIIPKKHFELMFKFRGHYFSLVYWFEVYIILCVMFDANRLNMMGQTFPFPESPAAYQLAN